MTPLLISFFLAIASVSVGVLAASVLKFRCGWLEAFSIGFSVILLGGLFFYERAAFEYYAYFLAVLPVGLCAQLFYSPGSVAWPSNSQSSMVLKDESSQLLMLGSAVLVLVTILTRLPVSNFLFEIGDAGSYVNSANSLAATGKSASQFFPLNQILLGIFSSLGGFRATPYGVVFSGLLSLAYAYALGATLFGSRKWGALAAFLVSFNVLAMWFSRLPYSETLMLAVNLGALSFCVSAAKGDRPRLDYILFGLFVALACANRVTGIVWMMLLMAVAIVTAFQDRERFRQLLPGAVIAVAGYVASIYVALKIGPGYYMEWQIKEFLPFIDSRRDLLIFHAVWAVTAATLVFLSYRNKEMVGSVWSWLGKRSVMATSAVLALMIPVAVLFVSGGKEVMGVTFFEKLSAGRFPQDAYFLWNYFTPASLLLFPIGLVWAVRRMNPFVQPHTLAVWLFSILFLIVHYVRVAYEKPHDVYLYWDRYFLSEVFIVFVLVLTAGLVWLGRRTWTRVFLVVFLGGYFAYGAVWLSHNRSAAYLDGAEEAFAWLQRVIPQENVTVFLDADYEGRWVFPNIRRSLMIPLARSFGYTVNLGPRGDQPFTADVPLDAKSLDGAFGQQREVFVIRARRYRDEGQYLLEGTRSMQLVAEQTFSIKAKSYSPGRVFASDYRHYPLYLAVYRARDNAILPGEVSTSGFYSDNMWTSGEGRLSGFERCSEKRYRSLLISTGGNHPWWESPERIGLSVSINGVPAKGKWLSPKRYHVTLSEPERCISAITISSSTFVPADLGMNADTRQLGLDIVRLKPEE